MLTALVDPIRAAIYKGRWKPEEQNFREAALPEGKRLFCADTFVIKIRCCQLPTFGSIQIPG